MGVAMTVGRRKQYDIDVTNFAAILGYVSANTLKMDHEKATYEW